MKNVFKERKLTNKKGITLIALILTVIILIILAGVSIGLLGGENGLITKAKQTKNEAETVLQNEQDKIDDIREEIKNKYKEPLKLVDIITSANYGDKVNYQVTVNGVTLGNGTNGELDWWKIFYKDEATNEVILMYGDYLPNTTGIAAGAGLTTSGDYGLYSNINTDRADLINKLNDTSKWSSLIRSDLAGKATAKGAVDLETWVASWNAKNEIKLFTATTSMSDGLNGYYVGTSENPTSNFQDLSSTSGYIDEELSKLYFPYKTNKSNYLGYWLASPSAGGAGYVMRVYYSGQVSSITYNNGNSGACPAVYLTSDVYTSGKDASGAWVIE